MTETFDFSQLMNLIQDFGMWMVFAWLYVQEKKAHQTTREQYRDDLREIANLRSNLSAVQSAVRASQELPKTA